MPQLNCRVYLLSWLAKYPHGRLDNAEQRSWHPNSYRTPAHYIESSSLAARLDIFGHLGDSLVDVSANPFRGSSFTFQSDCSP
jgi:hypothetical protein